MGAVVDADANTSVEGGTIVTTIPAEGPPTDSWLRSDGAIGDNPC